MAVLPAVVFSPASLLPLPALASVFIVVLALRRPGWLEALPLLLLLLWTIIHVLIFFQLLDEWLFGSFLRLSVMIRLSVDTTDIEWTRLVAGTACRYRKTAHISFG